MKKVRIGSRIKNSRPIFDKPTKPTPRYHCIVPDCNKHYSTYAGLVRHYRRHLKRGEVVLKWFDDGNGATRYGYVLTGENKK